MHVLVKIRYFAMIMSFVVVSYLFQEFVDARQQCVDLIETRKWKKQLKECIADKTNMLFVCICLCLCTSMGILLSVLSCVWYRQRLAFDLLSFGKIKKNSPVLSAFCCCVPIEKPGMWTFFSIFKTFHNLKDLKKERKKNYLQLCSLSVVAIYWWPLRHVFCVTEKIYFEWKLYF